MRARPALLMAGAILLAACASDGYSDSGTEQKLQDAGLTSEQADCVVRGMEKRIGANRLGGRDEPSESQRERMAEILEDCGVTEPSAPSS
jgi:hypothetical protein